MKYKYSVFTTNINCIILQVIIVLCISFSSYGQVVIPFKQRASNYTPTKKTYKVKGDFTMLGNTNLTLQNYDNSTNNNNQIMRYVDIDDDPNTFNSSSASLTLSAENGAIPSCSNIVYAGLYWTGRSKNENTFIDSLQTGTETINNSLIIIHNQSIPNTNYLMNISRNSPNETNTNPIYTFSQNNNTYTFNYSNDTDINFNPIISLSINGVFAQNISTTEIVTGTIATATFVTPYIINDGDVTISIISLIRNTATNLSLEETTASSKASIIVSGTIPIYTEPKLFDKRVVYLKGPNATNYTKIIADEGDIYYPTGTPFTIQQQGIFSGYQEITNYVKTNGIGNYFVADIALIQGNGANTGFSGGWGIIVVYENSKMKSRDITIFDGYAFVKNEILISEFDLPITGFNTIPSGNVGMKLGVMASEGDVSLTGDYFKIKKISDSSYLSLHHSSNLEDNFFNSSINTPGIRNPSLENNTGMDISMFTVPNLNNTVIGNNQTAVNFKYGTDGDIYSIFSIAMAVDSYFPKIEGKLTATSINNIPTVSEPYISLPGQEIGFNLDIKNLSNEAIVDSKFIIPIPFNTTYIAASATGTVLFSPLPTPNLITFDSSLGANGSLVWNLGNLPLPTNPNTLLAKLSFKLKTTQDCSILNNSICSSAILVDGFSSGTGASSGVDINTVPFIKGYSQAGVCANEPMVGGISIAINAGSFINANCQNSLGIRNFVFPNLNPTITVDQIAGYFPIGTTFYNSFPITTSSLEFTTNNPFPLLSSEGTTYYAITPNGNLGCSFPFTISTTKIIIANNDNITINGTSGNSNAGNVLLDNSNGFDTLSGTSIAINQVNLTITTAAVSINSTPVPTVNSNTGQINIPAGISFGTYTIVYQICEKTNPTNCSSATLTIIIQAAFLLNAQNDIYASECSNNTILGNVLLNDTLNGSTINPSEIVLTLVSSNNSNIILNTNTGEISLVNNTGVGQYSLEYKICQASNLNNCATATITINITDTINPVIPTLDDIIVYCFVTLIPPIALDNCAGPITGTTTDSLFYYEFGTHIVTWNFDDGNGNAITATQNVIIKSEKTNAINSDLADCNKDIDKVIDLNTLLPIDIPIDGIWIDVENSNGLTDSEFRPYGVPVGFYIFKYVYKVDDCYKSFAVTMKVADDCFVLPAGTCTIKVHNAFSPNNDERNDFFEIELIDDVCILKSNVKIYNRWGVLVFETNQYNNLTNAFTGRSKGRVTINESADLPTGTYFYNINCETTGKPIHEDGYLYLAR